MSMSTAESPEASAEIGYPAAMAWIAAVVFGLGAGSAGAMLQRWFAPIGVFPLALGVIVGLATGGVWAGRGGGTKRSILASAALGALCCLTALHVGSYLLAEREAEIERRKVREAMLKLIPEPGQFDALKEEGGIQRYFTTLWYGGRRMGVGDSSRRIKGWALLAWWICDALLLSAGALLAAAGVGKPHAARRPATAGAAAGKGRPS